MGICIDFADQRCGDIGQVVPSHGLIAVAVAADGDDHDVTSGNRKSSQVDVARQIGIGGSAFGVWTGGANAQARRINRVAVIGIDHGHRDRQIVSACSQGQKVVGTDRSNGIFLAVNHHAVIHGRAGQTAELNQVFLRIRSIRYLR